MGSPLDSVIEVLDAQGNAIPRATIRCLNQTTTTLSDRDSRTTGVRLTSTSGLHVGDYLMIGDELDQIDIHCRSARCRRGYERNRRSCVWPLWAHPRSCTP